MKKMIKSFVLEHRNIIMGVYSAQAFAVIASMLFGKTAMIIAILSLIASFVFLAVNDITFSELMEDENLFYIDEYEWEEEYEPKEKPVRKANISRSTTVKRSNNANTNIYEFPGKRRAGGKHAGHHSA